MPHTAHTLAERGGGGEKCYFILGFKKNGVNPSLTTDNASTICNSVKEAVLSVHIRYFAHTLNLSTRKALDLPQINR